jgi:hypothetical protein
MPDDLGVSVGFMRRDANRSRSATSDQAAGSGAVPDQRVTSQSAEYNQTQARGGTATGYPATQEDSRQARGRHAETEAYDESYDRRDVDVPRRHYFGMAGVLMVLSGLLTLFLGMVGVIHGIFFNRVVNYPFYYSTLSRGITFIVLGGVAVVVGLALLVHMFWARHIATVVAVLTAIAMFMFLPFYPFWSIALLALNVLIIWELTRERERRRELARLHTGRVSQRLRVGSSAVVSGTGRDRHARTPLPRPAPYRQHDGGRARGQPQGTNGADGTRPQAGILKEFEKRS